jgi:hypothetical protein
MRAHLVVAYLNPLSFGNEFVDYAIAQEIDVGEERFVKPGPCEQIQRNFAAPTNIIALDLGQLDRFVIVFWVSDPRRRRLPH